MLNIKTGDIRGAFKPPVYTKSVTAAYLSYRCIFVKRYYPDNTVLTEPEVALLVSFRVYEFREMSIFPLSYWSLKASIILKIF
jgi:hypothetical protein